MIEAELVRLRDEREELARAWILRVLEQSSLEQIARLSIERAARELPPLIDELLDALASGPMPVGDRNALAAGPAAGEPDARLLEIARRLLALREGSATAPGELARDVAALRSVVVQALSRSLSNPPVDELMELMSRLAEAFEIALAATVSEVVGARAKELEALANTDPLTGLFNVRYMQRQLDQLLGAQQRYGDPFAVLMLDLDALKAVNDSFGHAAGDRALVAVGQTIRRRTRVMDTAIRVAGDEFCVLAPRQTAAGGRALGERISEAVAAIDDDIGVRLAVSVGVVSCPEHGTDRERLLELADRAMYESKGVAERVVVAATT